MRVLYFGTYERDYPRNAQVISCLRRAGVEVVERHVGVWEGRRDSWRAGPATLARVAAAELRLLRAPEAEFTVDGTVVHAGPGTWVAAPVGVEHGFRVAGDSDLVMLNVHGPNTGFGQRLRD